MTHAPASPSAAPSERAENERDPSATLPPSLPPRPRRSPGGGRAWGAQSPGCPTPGADARSDAKRFWCASPEPGPRPRVPPSLTPRGRPCCLPPPSSPPSPPALFLLKKKKRPSPTPIAAFLPARGGSGRGRTRSKNPPRISSRGVSQKPELCLLLLSGTLPPQYIVKTASGDWQGLPVLSRSFEGPGLGQILGGWRL